MTGGHKKHWGGEQNRSKFEREQRDSAEFSQKLKSRKLPEKKIQKNLFDSIFTLDGYSNDTTHKSLR